MFASVLSAALTMTPLLAQSGGQKYGVAWGVIILLVALGLILTLTPAKRTSEVKKPADDES